MQKIISLFVLVIFFSLNGQAQFTRYVIQLNDKGTNSYAINNPSQYLSQRSIDRRTRYNIAIDSSDLPVTARYIDSIRLAGDVTILNISKWLNQVSIQTTDANALDKINNFPFVVSTNAVASRNSASSPINKKLSLPADNNSPVMLPSLERIADFYNYGLSEQQVKIHNGDFLHNHGFRGEDMQLTVLDAGFFHYQTLPTFDSARINNQILGTWDFVANEESVDEDYFHGMQCFSAIGANMPGVFVGTAPKANFYLFRTEDVASEYPIEEFNYAAGLERADSLGVDITSTSLGYTEFDSPSLSHTYTDMNGNTTMSAKAADWAAKKGMLMVIAAGNEGNSSWHYLTTPSDADSALSVGAVDVAGITASFSGYGPSSDGQIKPSVAAVGSGAVVANPNSGQPILNNGTSFACPNMAGIATCLWQAFQEINNMGIIDALQQSASRSANPDDRQGYGIPDAKKAFVMLQKRLFTKESSISGCFANLQFTVKTDNTMLVEIERKAAGELSYTTISSLQDNGNYGSHTFNFADDISNLTTGNISYRLKMTIASDTSFYLDSMMVNYANSCEDVSENSIRIGPNPVSGNLNITIGRTDNVKVQIIMSNAAGQRVYSNSFEQAAGLQTKLIPMQAMSKGVYFVSVYINNKKELTKKILRQ